MFTIIRTYKHEHKLAQINRHIHTRTREGLSPPSATEHRFLSNPPTPTGAPSIFGAPARSTAIYIMGSKTFAFMDKILVHGNEWTQMDDGWTHPELRKRLSPGLDAIKIALTV